MLSFLSRLFCGLLFLLLIVAVTQWPSLLERFWLAPNNHHFNDEYEHE